MRLQGGIRAASVQHAQGEDRLAMEAARRRIPAPPHFRRRREGRSGGPRPEQGVNPTQGGLGAVWRVEGRREESRWGGAVSAAGLACRCRCLAAPNPSPPLRSPQCRLVAVQPAFAGVAVRGLVKGGASGAAVEGTCTPAGGCVCVCGGTEQLEGNFCMDTFAGVKVCAEDERPQGTAKGAGAPVGLHGIAAWGPS